MSEHLTVSMAPIDDYKEHYPDAVEDVEKAHVMAEAGDDRRTRAAELRLAGKKIVELYTTTTTDKEVVAGIAAGRATVSKEYEKFDGQPVPYSVRREAYALEAANRALSDTKVSEGTLDAEGAVKSIAHKLQEAESDADAAEAAAGARVDKREEMLKSLGVEPETKE